ncbi:uncharacterized protein [Amphiura filiformis]|uniref:uncharacterized protein n=1 Tax=Amphiura filiformis TaxID=82378 RepID=UPI003B2276C7
MYNYNFVFFFYSLFRLQTDEDSQSSQMSEDVGLPVVSQSESSSSTNYSELQDEEENIDGDMELVEEQMRRKKAKSRPKKRTYAEDTSDIDISESVLSQLPPISKKQTVPQKAIRKQKQLVKHAAVRDSSMDSDDSFASDLSENEQVLPRSSTPKQQMDVDNKRRKVPVKHKPANKARPNTLDKMDHIFTQMADQQKQQQLEMLESMTKMQNEMIKQQMEFEREAQKSAQEHELKIMQLLMNRQPQPVQQYQGASLPNTQYFQAPQQQPSGSRSQPPLLPPNPSHQQVTARPMWTPPPQRERNVFSSAVAQSLNLN